MTKITKILTTIKLTPILTATVLVGVIFLLGPGIPINAEVTTDTEWLACRPTGTPVIFNGFPFFNPGAPTCNLISGIALNDLVGGGESWRTHSTTRHQRWRIDVFLYPVR